MRSLASSRSRRRSRRIKAGRRRALHHVDQLADHGDIVLVPAPATQVFDCKRPFHYNHYSNTHQTECQPYTQRRLPRAER